MASFELLLLASLCLSFHRIAVTYSMQKKRNGLMLLHTEPSGNPPETSLRPETIFLIGPQGRSVDDKSQGCQVFEPAAG